MHGVAEHMVTLADPATWDQRLRAFPDYTVFHTLPWLQTVSAAHGLKIVLTQLGDDDHCAAIWPLLEMRKGPFRILGSPLPGWSTAYMGPLFAPDEDADAALAAFMESSIFRRYAYFACRVIDRDRPIDLGAHGFSVVRRFDTYRIDLSQDEDVLWGNLKQECRTRIRKAQKLGVEVRPEPDDGFIDEYWKMALETFAKSNIQPTHSKQFAQEMWQRLSVAGSIEAISAFVDGRRIATLILPFDENAMYYWGGAGYVEFRDVPAHNLLHWTAITSAKQRGLREYDLISTVGGPGRFKKTFGPQTVDFVTHWERSPSRLMAALKRRYERYLRRRRVAR